MASDELWSRDDIQKLVAQVRASVVRRRLVVTIETDTFPDRDPVGAAGAILSSAACDDPWWDQAVVIQAHWEA